MDNPSASPQKKGLGGLAWLGIGCGGAIFIFIVLLVLGFGLFGTKIKKFADDVVKDPTRTTATTMVNVSMGQIEMVKEDADNKRYTVREKRSGKLTTIYWNAKKNAPEVVEGDFSAIPADANPPATPAVH